MADEWQGYYKIRVGNARVIFWIDRNENVIYVDYIGASGDVYKSNP